MEGCLLCNSSSGLNHSFGMVPSSCITFPWRTTGNVLGDLWEALPFLRFCREDKKKGAVVWAPGHAAWSFGIWWSAGSLRGWFIPPADCASGVRSKHLLQLVCLKGQPLWLAFQHHFLVIISRLLVFILFITIIILLHVLPKAIWQYICFWIASGGKGTSLREARHVVWPKEDRILLNYFKTGGARAQVGEQGRSFV